MRTRLRLTGLGLLTACAALGLGEPFRWTGGENRHWNEPLNWYYSGSGEPTHYWPSEDYDLVEFPTRSGTTAPWGVGLLDETIDVVEAYWSVAFARQANTGTPLLRVLSHMGADNSGGSGELELTITNARLYVGSGTP